MSQRYVHGMKTQKAQNIYFKLLSKMKIEMLCLQNFPQCSSMPNSSNLSCTVIIKYKLYFNESNELQFRESLTYEFSSGGKLNTKHSIKYKKCQEISFQG